MIDWPTNAPDKFIDDNGNTHNWDDYVEDDEGAPQYTYRELVVDLAEAQGQNLAEYFETRGHGPDTEDPWEEMADS